MSACLQFTQYSVTYITSQTCCIVVPCIYWFYNFTCVFTYLQNVLSIHNIDRPLPISHVYTTSASVSHPLECVSEFLSLPASSNNSVVSVEKEGQLFADKVHLLVI